VWVPGRIDNFWWWRCIVLTEMAAAAEMAAVAEMAAAVR
jgi:hypothetical protein